MPLLSYTATRGWAPDAMQRVIARLESRGWVRDSGLTDSGLAARLSIEQRTDAQEQPIVAALGDRLDEVPGSSLVPPDGDPVLFTTAGMHPLTRYLEEGRPHPRGRRLTGVQRCLRTTDLAEVGDDRHLTVFQMLGSWSLGDYDGPQSLR